LVALPASSRARSDTYASSVSSSEHLVAPGGIDGDHVHTPGIFVKRILQGVGYSKRIEKRTTRDG